MNSIETLSETERPNGWLFDMQHLDATGALHRHRISLSWADYNLWSGDGGDAPALVAEAVLRFLLDRVGREHLRPSFDASIARRLATDADEQIPGLIG